MSVVLGKECPHCQKYVYAEFVAEWITTINGRNVWTVAFKCVGCQFGIFAVANPLASARPSDGNGDLARTPAFQLLETYPQIAQPSIPPYLPPHIDIELFYREALDNEVRGNWNSCGSMCRKVIDVATIEMGSTKSKKLDQRINELASRHLLTPQLQEWAHAIRLDGNDAVHDSDPFSEEEAHQIRAFTELFLMYVYTLPGMLNERKLKTAPGTPPTAIPAP